MYLLSFTENNQHWSQNWKLWPEVHGEPWRPWQLYFYFKQFFICRMWQKIAGAKWWALTVVTVSPQINTQTHISHFYEKLTLIKRALTLWDIGILLTLSLHRSSSPQSWSSAESRVTVTHFHPAASHILTLFLCLFNKLIHTLSTYTLGKTGHWLTGPTLV